MRYANLFAPLLLATTVVLPGCGESRPQATVHGTVTMNGELVHGGRVTFHPDDKGPIAYGSIDDQGAYTLRVGRGNNQEQTTLHAGTYTVTVVVTLPSDQEDPLGDGGPPQPGPRISAAKYAVVETSDLKFEIQEGDNVINLEIERAAETPPADADSSGDAAEEAEAEAEAEAESSREAISPEERPASASGGAETGAASAAEGALEAADEASRENEAVREIEAVRENETELAEADAEAAEIEADAEEPQP